MASYKRKLNNMLKHNQFSELLPVLEYWDDEQLFVLDGPAIGAMLICSPTPGCNDELRNSFNNIYKSDLPKGSTIQSSLVSLPDIEDSLYGYQSIRGGRMKNIDEEQCSAMANSIHDFYKQGTTKQINENGFKFRDFEFWVTIKVPIKKALPSSKEIKKFNETVKQITAMLAPFSPNAANEFDYKRRMFVLMNMFDKSGWRNKAKHEDTTQASRPLKELILAQGKKVDVESNGLSIKDSKGNECQFVKSLSITEMPETMVYGQMLNLVGDWESGYSGLFEHFMITLNIIYPDQQKAKSKLAKERSFVTNQAKGPIIQFLDKLRYQKRDFDAINRELDQEGSKLIQYSMNVCVFSESEEKAEAFSEQIIGNYSRKNITLVEDNYFALPLILSSLPFGLDETFVTLSSRFNNATSKAAVFLTPHMASWKGNTGFPAFMLSSRLGQVVNLDFFESETNYNIYCAATSGAGKSFFTGYLVNAMLGIGDSKQPNVRNKIEDFDDGSQVFIIDVGKSYEGLASQYAESQFMVFGREFKFSLNPWPSLYDFYGKEGEANMLRTLIKTMAAPSGQISDFQNAEILAVLTVLWEAKKNTATITDFAALCVEHEHEDMKMIGYQLKPFCDGGIYGDFFSNKYPPVNYKSRLVVCELEELKSDLHLQVVVLMSLVMAIQHSMYLSGTERRKQLIIDEGWQYLKEEDGDSMMKFFADFLETGWRRFRKTNGSGALITQNVMDGYGSAAGRAIINNSAWLLLMKQNDEAINMLENEKAYSGSKSDFSLLRSLRTVKPKPGLSSEAFSEVFVRYEEQKQVCRLYTDRKLQLILTTNPKEKTIRQSYIDRGMTLVQAIEAMYEDELKAS